MILQRNIILGLMLISLAGCSSLQQATSSRLKKRDDAYLRAQSGQSLKVPAGLSTRNVGDDFTVPSANSSGPVPASVTPPNDQ